MTDLLNITIADGKYTVIQSHDGRLRALRYGEEWRDCVGDGLILALAQEVERLREGLKSLEGAIKRSDELYQQYEGQRNTIETLRGQLQSTNESKARLHAKITHLQEVIATHEDQWVDEHI